MATTELVRVLLRVRPDEESIARRSTTVVDVRGDGARDTHVIVRPTPTTSSRSQHSHVAGTGSKSRNHADSSEQAFQFDRVFGPTSSQEDVYSAVEPLVHSVLEGYNATVFAYGSTGSGKTYTIAGTEGNPGVVPRAIHGLFSQAQSITDRSRDAIVLIHMGYVELYNNQFRDLLCPSSSSSYFSATSSGNFNNNNNINSVPKIEIRTSSNGEVFLTGSDSLRTPVTCAAEALRHFRAGTKRRATSSTNCNDHSSRSHSILTFHVECRDPVSVDSYENDPSQSNANPLSAKAKRRLAQAVVRMAKLHIVDLAGSERVSVSGAEGSDLLEAQNINKSLSTLGDVLSALSRLNTDSTGHKPSSKKRASGHVGAKVGPKQSATVVPYRNSKLTSLLKDSLGGNAKTLMLAAIRQPVIYRQQTLTTLMYATRAKRIRNRTLVNTDVVGDSATNKLVCEIGRLRDQLKRREIEVERLMNAQQSQDGTVEEGSPERGRHDDPGTRRKLQHLSNENAREKIRLEECLRQVVHNHHSTLVKEQTKYSSLQDKLGSYRTTLHEQKEEINLLRQSVKQLAIGGAADSKEAKDLRKMVSRLAAALELARDESNQVKKQLAREEQKRKEQQERHNDEKLSFAEDKKLYSAVEKENGSNTWRNSNNKNKNNNEYDVNGGGGNNNSNNNSNNKADIMQTKMDEFQATIRTLRDRLKHSELSMQETNMEYTELKGEYTHKVEAMQTQLDQIEQTKGDHVERLTLENDKLRQTIRELRDVVKHLRTDRKGDRTKWEKETEKQRERYEQNIEDLNQQLVSKNENIGHLNVAKQAERAEWERANQEQREKYETDMAEQRKIVKAKSEQVDEMNVRMRSAQVELRAVADSSKSQLEGLLQQRDESRREAYSAKQEAEVRLNQLKRDTDVTIQKSTAALQRAEGRLEELMNTHESVKRDLQYTFDKKFKENGDILFSVQRKLDDKTDELTRSSEQVEEFKQTVSAQQVRITELKTIVKKREEELKRLMKQRNATDEVVKSLDAASQDTATRVQTLVRQLTKQQAVSKELVHEKNIMDAKLESAERERDVCKEKCDMLVHQRDDALVDTGRIQQQMSMDLKRVSAELQLVVGDAAREKKMASEALDEVREELERVATKLKLSDDQLVTSRRESAITIQDLKDELQDSKKKMDEMKSQGIVDLENMRNEVHTLQDKLQDSEKSMGEMKSQSSADLAGMRSEVHTLQDKLQDSKKKIDDLRSRSDQDNADLEDMRNMVHTLHETESRTHSQLQSQNQMLTNAHAKAARLEAQLCEMKGKCTSLESRLSDTAAKSNNVQLSAEEQQRDLQQQLNDAHSSVIALTQRTNKEKQRSAAGACALTAAQKELMELRSALDNVKIKHAKSTEIVKKEVEQLTVAVEEERHVRSEVENQLGHSQAELQKAEQLLVEEKAMRCELERQLNQFKSELERMGEGKKEVEEEVAMLEKKLTEVNLAQQNAEDEVQRLNKQMTEASQGRIRMEQGMVTLHNQLNEVQNLFDASEVRCANLEEQLEESVKKLEDSVEVSDKIRAKSEELETRLAENYTDEEEMKRLLNERETAISELERQYSAVKTDFQRTQQLLLDEQNMCVRMEEEQDIQKRQMSETIDELEETKNQELAIREELEESKRQVSEIRDELEHSMKQVSETKNALKQSERLVSQERSSRQQLEEQYDVVKANLERSKESLSQAEATRVSLTDEVVQLTSQLEQRNSDLENERGECTQLYQRCEVLEQQVEKDKGEIGVANEAREKLEEELKIARENERHMSNDLAKMNEKMIENDTDLANTKARETELDIQLQNLSSELQNTKAEVTEQETLLENMQARLDIEQSETHRLHDRLTDQELECGELQDKLSVTSEQLQHAVSELSENKRQCEELQSKFGMQTSELEQVMQTLEIKKTAFQHLEKKCSALQTELELSRAALNDGQNDLVDLQTSRANATAELERIKHELTVKETQCNGYIDDITSLQSQVTVLQDSLHGFERKFENELTAHKQTGSLHAASVNELDAAREEVEMLRRDLSEEHTEAHRRVAELKQKLDTELTQMRFELNMERKALQQCELAKVQLEEQVDQQTVLVNDLQQQLDNGEGELADVRTMLDLKNADLEAAYDEHKQVLEIQKEELSKVQQELEEAVRTRDGDSSRWQELLDERNTQVNNLKEMCETIRNEMDMSIKEQQNVIDSQHDKLEQGKQSYVALQTEIAELQTIFNSELEQTKQELTVAESRCNGLQDGATSLQGHITVLENALHEAEISFEKEQRAHKQTESLLSCSNEEQNEQMLRLQSDVDAGVERFEAADALVEELGSQIVDASRSCAVAKLEGLSMRIRSREVITGAYFRRWADNCHLLKVTQQTKNMQKEINFASTTCASLESELDAAMREKDEVVNQLATCEEQLQHVIEEQQVRQEELKQRDVASEAEEKSAVEAELGTALELKNVMEIELGITLELLNKFQQGVQDMCNGDAGRMALEQIRTTQIRSYGDQQDMVSRSSYGGQQDAVTAPDSLKYERRLRPSIISSAESTLEALIAHMSSLRDQANQRESELANVKKQITERMRVSLDERETILQQQDGTQTQLRNVKNARDLIADELRQVQNENVKYAQRVQVNEEEIRKRIEDKHAAVQQLETQLTNVVNESKRVKDMVEATEQWVWERIHQNENGSQMLSDGKLNGEADGGSSDQDSSSVHEVQVDQSLVLPGVAAALDHLRSRHTSVVTHKLNIERDFTELQRQTSTLESNLRSLESEAVLAGDKITRLEIKLDEERQVCSKAQEERNDALMKVTLLAERIASTDTQGLVKQLHGQARRDIEEAIGSEVQRGVSRNEAMVQNALQAISEQQKQDMATMLQAAATKVHQAEQHANSEKLRTNLVVSLTRFENKMNGVMEGADQRVQHASERLNALTTRIEDIKRAVRARHQRDGSLQGVTTNSRGVNGAAPSVVSDDMQSQRSQLSRQQRQQHNRSAFERACNEASAIQRDVEDLYAKLEVVELSQSRSSRMRGRSRMGEDQYPHQHTQSYSALSHSRLDQHHNNQRPSTSTYYPRADDRRHEYHRHTSTNMLSQSWGGAGAQGLGREREHAGGIYQEENETRPPVPVWVGASSSPLRSRDLLGGGGAVGARGGGSRTKREDETSYYSGFGEGRSAATYSANTTPTKPVFRERLDHERAAAPRSLSGALAREMDETRSIMTSATDMVSLLESNMYKAKASLRPMSSSSSSVSVKL